MILDDLLLLPARGVLWVAQQVHRAAQEEQAGETESITAELRELYMMLETGRIAEEEYDAREKTLLDRLEDLRRERNQP